MKIVVAVGLVLVASLSMPDVALLALAQPQTGTSEAAADAPAVADDPEQRAIKLMKQSQQLMADGKWDEGHEVAQKAKQQFTKADSALPRYLLESVTFEDHRVDVYLNLGERERSFPESGIVRPLRFHLLPKDDPASRPLRIIDFEISRFGGQSLTAAIGEMTTQGHANYGILDIDSKYATIRKAALDVLNADDLPLTQVGAKDDDAQETSGAHRKNLSCGAGG